QRIGFGTGPSPAIAAAEPVSATGLEKRGDTCAPCETCRQCCAAAIAELPPGLDLDAAAPASPPRTSRRTRDSRASRHATPCRPLPPRPRQALPAHRPARAGAGAPHNGDNDVPGDGDVVLVGEGGGGIDGIRCVTPRTDALGGAAIAGNCRASRCRLPRGRVRLLLAGRRVRYDPPRVFGLQCRQDLRGDVRGVCTPSLTRSIGLKSCSRTRSP